MAKQWISKFAFSFVKVPKEKESEFYAALKYFAVKILQYQDEEKAPLPPSPELPSGTENK